MAKILVHKGLQLYMLLFLAFLASCVLRHFKIIDVIRNLFEFVVQFPKH